MRYKLELSEAGNEQLRSVQTYAKKGDARSIARRFIKAGSINSDRYAILDDTKDNVTIYEACGNGTLGITVHTCWSL